MRVLAAVTGFWPRASNGSGYKPATTSRTINGTRSQSSWSPLTGSQTTGQKIIHTEFKQCKHAKNKSQTMAWTFYFLTKKHANWPLYFMSFQRSDEPTSKREQPPSCHGDVWRGLCWGREWGGVRFWGCPTSLPNLPRVIPFTNHVTYFVIKKFNVWEVYL